MENTERRFPFLSRHGEIIERKTKITLSSDFCFQLFLCLLENNALSKSWIKLGQFNLARNSLLILARPDDVRRLCRLELNETDL